MCVWILRGRLLLLRLLHVWWRGGALRGSNEREVVESKKKKSASFYCLKRLDYPRRASLARLLLPDPWLLLVMWAARVGRGRR